MILLEIIFGGVLEAILYGCLYWMGYLVLWAGSLGQLRMASLSTYGDTNWKPKWYHIDWSPWLQRPGCGKALKAEYVCLTGLVSMVVALIIIATVMGATSSEPATPPPDGKPPSVALNEWRRGM